ncbi:MAG: carbohydrate kinase family protein [Chloroflexota bacterium]
MTTDGHCLDVTCYGQITVDHIFHTEPTARPRLGRETFADSYTTALGGGAAIVAVTLARLGLRSALVSRVGADTAGIGLLNQVRAEGVDVAHVEILRDRATDISVAFTSARDRGFLSHTEASRVLDTLVMESACLARNRHLHLCLSSTDDPAHWSGLVHQAHAVGTTVSIDLGWQTTWDRGLCARLAEADLIFPNELEARHITHTRSLDRALALLGARGATVVIKRGSLGVVAQRRGERVEMPPLPVREVVDTTGAGDMFAAGFLWAHIHQFGLRGCLAAGSLCGARCVEQTGGLARPPTVQELQQLLDTLGSSPAGPSA